MGKTETPLLPPGRRCRTGGRRGAGVSRRELVAADAAGYGEPSRAAPRLEAGLLPQPSAGLELIRPAVREVN